MEKDKEAELQSAINEYYRAACTARSLKMSIIRNILRTDTSEFVLSILDNEGLSLDEKFNVLKQFIKE